MMERNVVVVISSFTGGRLWATWHEMLVTKDVLPGDDSLSETRESAPIPGKMRPSTSNLITHPTCIAAKVVYW